MSKFFTKMLVKGMMAKEKINNMFKNERGEANIIAIIIVIAIVIALAIVFRQNIKDLFDQIWGDIFDDVGSTTNNY